MRHAVDGGKAKVGFVIPGDYATRLARGEPAQVQVLIDGSDPTTAQTILSSAGAVAQSHSTELATETLARRGQARPMMPGIDLRPRVWYNPDMEAVKFNIPGLVGIILQNITLMLTSFAIVRERERGTLEQLIVTPIRPMELMIGKVVPYVVIGFVDLLLALGLGTYWFHVPIQGNVALLLSISMLFLLGALGIGLLISTVSRTQLQAMQLSMFLIMPNILLSGFMFPREAMPKAVYYVSNFIPLTYYLTVLRGIILKGVGPGYLWTQVVVLLVFGLGFLAASAARFRKRIE